MQTNKNGFTFPRQVTAPMYLVYPAVGPKYMTSKATRYRWIEQDEAGVFGDVPVANETRSIETLRNYKYNALIFDVFSALFAATTLPNAIRIESDPNDEETNPSRFLKVSIERNIFFQLLFGGLVDKNGRAIKGAGAAVRESKRQISEFLESPGSIPNIYASLKKGSEQTILSGKPFDFSSASDGSLTINLDRLLFQLRVNGSRVLPTTERFCRILPGLKSLITLGRQRLRVESGGRRDLPSPTEVHRLIVSIQAMTASNTFITGMSKRGGRPGLEVSIGREPIKDLRAQAVSHAGRECFSEFEQFVLDSLDIFHAGLDVAGTEQDLPAEIYIPALKYSERFPVSNPNVLKVRLIR